MQETCTSGSVGAPGHSGGDPTVERLTDRGPDRGGCSLKWVLPPLSITRISALAECPTNQIAQPDRNSAGIKSVDSASESRGRESIGAPVPTSCRRRLLSDLFAMNYASWRSRENGMFS
jgi:hypothetical protein